MKLPVIVGFGGYNAAGRASFNHAFKRMVFESINSKEQETTLQALQALTKLTNKEEILKNSLIRRIEKSYFDVDNIELPNGETYAIGIKSAGQLPSGFVLGEHYNARFHPRALQMTILGVSDAINASGLNFDAIKKKISPTQIGVFSGNIMSQLDDMGFGGMLQGRLRNKKITAKQCPLGMNSMPTDFINAYVLGSIGQSASITGACASFLYNLQKAIEQINLGKIKLAVVGNAEAPILPEIIEGYAAMSALATEKDLMNLDKSEFADFARASRPFGENCGFTIAESSQYIILMSDDLAIETGANIFASLPEVFVSADGYKRSISSPGVGNYLTVANAVNYAIDMVGLQTIQERSFVQAHGSSTPANRTTESKILDEVAKAFDIQDWAVSGVKSYLGHSLAPASGDQLTAILGTFAYNIIPGIKTIDKVADDVYQDNLQILTQDAYEKMDVGFINAKGFGGNNATAPVFSPEITIKMLEKRYTREQLNEYYQKLNTTQTQANKYDEQALKGNLNVIYNFGKFESSDENLKINKEFLDIQDFNKITYAKSQYIDLKFNEEEK